MRRWLRADVLSFDAKVPSIVIDKTTKAASDILKVHSFICFNSTGYTLKFSEPILTFFILYHCQMCRV